MPEPVDYQNVSTVGLESSPVAQALAGLRANEARYSKNKYDHFVAEGIRFAYVFHQSGLAINVMYGLEDDGSRDHPGLLLRDPRRVLSRAASPGSAGQPRRCSLKKPTMRARASAADGS